jgi:hypothetical protein
MAFYPSKQERYRTVEKEILNGRIIFRLKFSATPLKVLAILSYRGVQIDSMEFYLELTGETNPKLSVAQLYYEDTESFLEVSKLSRISTSRIGFRSSFIC